jgi:hypothetical protein
MANKLSLQEPKEIRTKIFKKFKLPNLQGQYGFSFLIGQKQFFVGLVISQIEIEKYIKRKRIEFKPTETHVVDLE